MENSHEGADVAFRTGANAPKNVMSESRVKNAD